MRVCHTASLTWRCTATSAERARCYLSLNRTCRLCNVTICASGTATVATPPAAAAARAPLCRSSALADQQAALLWLWRQLNLCRLYKVALLRRRRQFNSSSSSRSSVRGPCSGRGQAAQHLRPDLLVAAAAAAHILFVHLHEPRGSTIPLGRAWAQLVLVFMALLLLLQLLHLQLRQQRLAQLHLCRTAAATACMQTVSVPVLQKLEVGVAQGRGILQPVRGWLCGRSRGHVLQDSGSRGSQAAR